MVIKAFENSNRVGAIGGGLGLGHVDLGGPISSSPGDILGDVTRIYNNVLENYPEIETDFPNFKKLFGTADLCQCTHCRSVYSPAAYLTDLLNFLNNRNSIQSAYRSTNLPASGPTYIRTIKETLFYSAGYNDNTSVNKSLLYRRRADIGEIELTCSNSNTPMPYIDLACEILEDAIEEKIYESYLLPSNPTGNDKSEYVEIIRSFGLEIIDDCEIQELVNTMHGSFARILIVRDVNHSYLLIESNGYAVPTGTFGQNVVKIRELKQTRKTANQLKAKPEYTNYNVYDILKSQKFPFDLPFDLAWTEVNSALKQLGVPRTTLIDYFSTDAGKEYLHACEYFNISKVEADIIFNEIDTGDIADYWMSKKGNRCFKTILRYRFTSYKLLFL
ncbi:MAG: hypothetical protein IPK03_03260 [Bacteroidetes bacterium]|nr:hypothetical protein [Bacteroidota bacterium]